MADCRPTANTQPHMDLIAYIDPGAGSLVIQALVAALLSIPFFFRRTLSSTLDRLRAVRKEKADTDDVRAGHPFE